MSRIGLSRQQSGFTIVSAIFILVVLAVLGTFMVSVSTSQQIGSALDVQGSRAYQAARSGIDWGVYQVQATPAYGFGHANDPAATNPNLRVCFSPTPTSFTFPTAPTLKDFTVTVTCSASYDPSPIQTPTPASCDPASASPPYVASRCGPSVYRVTATACNQPSAGACPNISTTNSLYVERRLEVVF